MSEKRVLVETTSAPTVSDAKKGLFEIKIIQAGQGSSAYYPADVLERDGAMAFPAGTHSYWNHPTWSESFERPERDVKDIVGVLEGDPTFKDDALWGKLRVLPQHVPTIEAPGPHIGMSINATALVEDGEDADGGVRVVAFHESPFNSVDVVTVPGAGGAITSLLESAGRLAQTSNTSFPNQPGRGEVKESSMAQEQNGELSKLTEAVTGLVASVEADRAARTAEAAAARQAEEDAKKINPIDLAVELATKLAESGLVAVQFAKVAEAAANGVNVEDAIKAEKDYAAKILEAAGKSAPIGQVTGPQTHVSGTKDFADFDLDKLAEAMGKAGV